MGAGGDRSYQWGKDRNSNEWNTCCVLCAMLSLLLLGLIMPRDVYSAFEIRKLERELGAILPDYINATSSVVLKALDKKS